MSVNNQDRNVSVCALCETRRPNKFSQFCDECWHNCQKEIAEMKKAQKGKGK